VSVAKGRKIGGWYATIRPAPAAIASSSTAGVRSMVSSTRETSSSGEPASRPTLSQSAAYSSGAITSSAVTMSATCMAMVLASEPAVYGRDAVRGSPAAGWAGRRPWAIFPDLGIRRNAISTLVRPQGAR
jgi:hypothetical protein